jgi:hypothetical protein
LSELLCELVAIEKSEGEVELRPPERDTAFCFDSSESDIGVRTLALLAESD